MPEIVSSHSSFIMKIDQENINVRGWLKDLVEIK
jgi:hypothetical protein